MTKKKIKAEDQRQKQFVFVMKWRVSGSWEVLVKSWFLRGILMDTGGNMLRVLKVYMRKRYWEKKCRRKKIAEVLG